METKAEAHQAKAREFLWLYFISLRLRRGQWGRWPAVYGRQPHQRGQEKVAALAALLLCCRKHDQCGGETARTTKSRNHATSKGNRRLKKELGEGKWEKVVGNVDRREEGE